uniref:Glycosyl transferase group 1 n=1 Tax=Caulobacter sp. (strain K31) TaxID=366602 RepID=B0T6Z7_CAUSK
MNSLAPHRDAFATSYRPGWAVATTRPDIVLDLSRLLSRVFHATPTGVDRVEMAYAQTLLKLAPQRLRFTAIHPAGWHGDLSTVAARRFLDATLEQWTHGEGHRTILARCRDALAVGRRHAPGSGAWPAVYLHLSARGLERTNLLRSAQRRHQARFVPFVHDLIPLEHPEYARPGGMALYRRKIAAVADLADAVLVNSEATARALAPYLHAAGREISIHVAPLASTFAPLPARAEASDTPPYFVVLGTIEPRKNHLLLLNVWRRMVETLGPSATPRLVVIGRRGWENENVLDLLDRCPALEGVVIERGRLADPQVRGLVAGARAVLAPSFAEGFCLPMVEALALRTPVIASDLAVLRQTGGDAPDYLDPLDGPAWFRAILDYALPGSVPRRAQLARLSAWRPSSWEDHVGGVLDFLAETQP